MFCLYPKLICKVITFLPSLLLLGERGVFLPLLKPVVLPGCDGKRREGKEWDVSRETGIQECWLKWHRGMFQLQLCCKADLNWWAEVRGEGSAGAHLYCCSAGLSRAPSTGGGVGNAGGRMSTAGHSWSDPLINCLLLFYLLQSFYFCIICFPVQVKQRGTFWNLNSEVLELSSCWGKSWSSAPDGFWNGWQCFIVSRSLPKAGTILLCWATWLSLCYQTSQEWEQNRNACCYLKDP